MNNAESSQLISDCITGNERSIETLVYQYKTDVFRLALSIVGDAGEASEVMQETFIAALKSLGTYQERLSFKAWLFKIAVNTSRSHLRNEMPWTGSERPSRQFYRLTRNNRICLKIW